MRKYLFYITLFLLLSGCTVSQSVVSRGVDLSKYKYVAIIDNDTYRIPPELVQYQIQLYDAVERSGLAMVSQFRIDNLSRSEHSSLLIATFGVTVKDEETVITVNFEDFDTGRPLASCQGAYTTLGISRRADMKGAIGRVGEQIAKTFKR